MSNKVFYTYPSRKRLFSVYPDKVKRYQEIGIPDAKIEDILIKQINACLSLGMLDPEKQKQLGIVFHT